MDDHVDTFPGNLTQDHLAHVPSVWSLVKERLDSMVDQAIQRTQMHLVPGNTVMENFKKFKQRLEELLEEPLKNVAPGHSEGQGYPHTIHTEVEDAVEGAVDEAMQELNMTDVAASNTSLSAIRERLVITLDSEIELDVFNKVFTNGSYEMEKTSDFFHSLPVKDETMFVALVCMAVIIPAIFITLLIIFFYRRQNENKERRQEMLLQDQPEFSLDEYNAEDRQLTLKVEIPDVELMNLRI